MTQWPEHQESYSKLRSSSQKVKKELGQTSETLKQQVDSMSLYSTVENLMRIRNDILK